MLLTFDTNAGAFTSLVPNYVEGSGESIKIVLPLHPEFCPCCIEDAFSEVEGYVQENLHELYAIVDQMKGKELRSALLSTYQQLQSDWEEMGAILAIVGDDAEGAGADDLHSLQEDLNALGNLMSAKKNHIKDSLKLVEVLIDPESPEITLHWGTDEINSPVLALRSCGLDI